jgi:hypothetical protein
MRKFFLFVAALCSMVAMSQVVDGINYEIITDTTVLIVANDPAYSGDIVIPARVTIDGQEYQVTEIGYNAFEYCDELTSVVLPVGIKTIGDNAFQFCNKLGSINFPEGLVEIGSDAFWGCDSLKSVVLPSSLKSLNAYAFEECPNLVSCNLPNGVEYVGEYVFAGDSLLGTVMNDSVVAWVSYAETSFAIPEGIKAMAGSACYFHKNLKQVTFPSTMQVIPYTAFEYSGLTSVVIPDNIDWIGSSAFSYCEDLTSVTIGNGVRRIYSDAFGECTNLTNLTWGTAGNLEVIDGGAFYNTGLTSVTVPEGVKRLQTYYGRGVFTGCKNLKTVSLPASLTEEIAYNTFKNCPIESITVAAGNTVFDSRDNCNAVIHTETNTLKLGFATTVIPASVKAIGYGAFQECTNLTSIVIPEGVTYIDHYAFFNCTSLTSITIPNTVRRAGYQIFDGTRLTEPVYNQYVFFRMPYAALATGEYTVPAGIEQIAGYAFADCSDLTAIHLPASLKIVDTEAFWNCVGVTEIVIPDNVDTIADYAFDYMENVTKITLPANLKLIGAWVFAGCNQLEQIICPAAEVPASLYGNAIDLVGDLNDPSSIKLYVPDASVSAYEGADGWKEFDVQPISDVPTAILSPSLQGMSGEATKSIRNGQLLIEKSGHTYNVLGTQVR